MRKLAGMRVTAGFSQDEVAAALGVAQGTVSAWERRTIRPSLEKVPQLARLYGVKEQDIVEACLDINLPSTNVNGKEGLDNDQGLRHAIQNQQE